MIKATKNQLGNLHNKAQTPKKKVLCVCSAGILRSPTLANVLHQELGYNTRACGSVKSFALVPITEALIRWADEIVFTEWNSYDELNQEERDLVLEKKISILDISDTWDWNDPKLREECLKQYVSIEPKRPL